MTKKIRTASLSGGFSGIAVEGKAAALNYIINQTREHFLPYYQKNDEAHRITHADDVCKEALRIALVVEERGYEVCREALILAAYAHDMFTAEDREEHHIMAKQYLEDDAFRLDTRYSDHAIRIAAQAVESHRASWGGGYYDINAEIIATADRGRPDYAERVYRSYKYGVGKLGYDHDAALEHAWQHIRDKFHPKSGYAKRGDLYMDIYKDEIEAFNHQLEVATLEDVREIVVSKTMVDSMDALLPSRRATKAGGTRTQFDCAHRRHGEVENHRTGGLEV